jgi:RNA polymerase sigma-70 factor (ECF subfamily)
VVPQGGTTVAEHPDSERERRFRQLYDAHYWAIRAYALRRTGQPADAEEIVAAVFATAWRHPGTPTEPSRQRVWLLGVARNTLANQRRAARRRRHLTERLKTTWRPAEPAAAGADRGDQLSQLESALNDLPEADRELLLLNLWEDLTHAELAALLGTTPNAIAIRLHRARQKLRDNMRAAHTDGDPAGTATSRAEPRPGRGVQG